MYCCVRVVFASVWFCCCFTALKVSFSGIFVSWNIFFWSQFPIWITVPATTGTYWGLCRLLLSKCTSYEEVLDLAEAGDATEIDMLVKDIYGGGCKCSMVLWFRFRHGNVETFRHVGPIFGIFYIFYFLRDSFLFLFLFLLSFCLWYFCWNCWQVNLIFIVFFNINYC